jgi:hypothetical protein
MQSLVYSDFRCVGILPRVSLEKKKKEKKRCRKVGARTHTPLDQIEPCTPLGRAQIQTTPA